jgi:hypothetical protein
MFNRNLLITIIAIIIGISAGYFIATQKSAEPVACTMEAKLCPDGSAVGRVGLNCEFAECPGADTSTPITGDVTLGVGKTGKVGNLSITLNEITQDSRCPVNVQCIWAGEVKVSVIFSYGSQIEAKNISSNDPSYLFAGYLISIASVSPVKKSGEEISAREYRITFGVKKSPADSAKNFGTIKGSVILSPTCPVERIPPDPNCAPKPYETTVQVIEIGSPKSSAFATAKTDKNGKYQISLPPGKYALQPVGGSILPRCETKEVVISSGSITEINLSCDTGIR